MPNQDFTEISKRYQETSTIQSSASDSLFALLNFKHGEAVLDVGCGTGDLTNKILDKTGNDLVGIDPSLGMIVEAIDNYGTDITFYNKSAEDIDFCNEFDAIFCNSAFQWLKDPNKAISNFYKVLKPNGRIGIQAPGTDNYCPNFIQAVEALKHNDKTKDIYSKFISPWFFLNDAEDYTELFLKQHFYVAFSTIQTVETYHSPEDTYKIFASGAIAGYLNKDYYGCDLTENYINEFNKVIKEEFCKQAIYDGKVKLVFNRIYLVAVK
jgi:ubiquinone/menaquinone biosynthesis C-methylase UbiE